LLQQVGQRELSVASGAQIHQMLPGQLAQTEPFVQLPNQDQTAIGSLENGNPG
jgi:hypothetical protein